MKREGQRHVLRIDGNKGRNDRMDLQGTRVAKLDAAGRDGVGEGSLDVGHFGCQFCNFRGVCVLKEGIDAKSD
jgi:hypothetical protein